MNNRDDFTQKTKDILRERAGNRCSNPTCLTPTSAPASSQYMKLNGGRAAHICAAAPGGKRYNPCMTSEQRKHISNGIWLCERCSSTIDQDELDHPVELLVSWKEQSERKALEEYNNPHIQTGIFNTEQELKKARNFINFLSPLFPDLIESIRNSGRSYSEESRIILAHIYINFGIYGWNNRNEFWSFNPSIKSRQDYIIQLCQSLERLFKDSRWQITTLNTGKKIIKYKPNEYILSAEDREYLDSVVRLEKILLDTLNDFAKL